jgi:methionine sulfoxide reductase heme-binding subunit
MSSPVLWYATRATGLMALVLLSLTLVLGLLTSARFRSERWPGFAQQDLHRRVSILTVAFLVIHVLTSVMDRYVHIGWAAIVVPFASGYKPLWVAMGTISLDLMAAVFVTSLLRHHIPARLWRGLHWLVYASWPVALAHSLAIGSDERTGWVLALTAACIFAVVVAGMVRLAAAAQSLRRALAVSVVRHRPMGVARKYLSERRPASVRESELLRGAQ